MQRYFFQIHGGLGMDEDPAGVVLTGTCAAMLHAVTMCAEIGYASEFHRGFAVSVRDDHGAVVGRVSAVVVIASLERRNV